MLPAGPPACQEGLPWAAEVFRVGGGTPVPFLGAPAGALVKVLAEDVMWALGGASTGASLTGETPPLWITTHTHTQAFTDTHSYTHMH